MISYQDLKNVLFNNNNLNTNMNHAFKELKYNYYLISF